MKRSSRLAVAAASLLLLAVYVLPLWHINLIAPQYPEGLGLRIWVDQITGLKPNDLNSINGLNHYIGMRAIEPESFPELRFMPKLLAAAIAAGLLVALVGRRPLLYAWAGLFTLGAVAGLGDFWKWGYDYGHQLDPHAAIKVPGMSYQPPIIGSKQLLNFHATSWPGPGGWIAIAALACIIAVAVVEWRRARDGRGRGRAGGVAASAAIAAACAGPAPRPIAFGEESCRHCHMAIVDPRFAAELVTDNGRVYTFDDVGCLAAFVREGTVPAAEVHSLWVYDYLHPDSLLDARQAVYLGVDSLRTPMSSHLAALRPGPEADELQARLGGELFAWDELPSGVHGG